MFILIIRLIQLVCVLVMIVCMLMRVVAWWDNNHFVDDKGRRYKRTKTGFKYY